MKKIVFILLLLFCLSVTACSSTPNMNELLSYQKDGAVFDVRIADGSQFPARVTLGERDSIELSDGEMENIRFLFDEDGASLSYGDTVMPLPDTALVKAKTWIDLFRLPTSGLWHIKRETLGSTEVFVCACDDVTLYIDAATRLPLQIARGECVIYIDGAS